MSVETTFEQINVAKANMDDVYDQSDPRAYFRELHKLDYAIPDNAKPIFQNLIRHLQKRRDDKVHVLDLGCSYGVNAALLKHDLSMDELYEHWDQNSLVEATSEEILTHDRRFMNNLDESEDISVTGLDQADAAISFAKDSGLLDNGITVNLETDSLSALEKKELAPIDLMISTGCVGYMTEKSFECLLPAVTQGQPPWIANFVARMFPFDTIEKTLNDWGYVTEKLEGRTFDQRHFASAQEQEQVIDQLSTQGIDPAGKETEGHLLAEFYLSRPASEVAKTPLEQLLAS